MIRHLYCQEAKPRDARTSEDGTLEELLDVDKIVCPLKRIYTDLSESVGASIESMYRKHNTARSDHLAAMILLFARATYTKGPGTAGVPSPKENARVPLLAWKSTAYTIHAIEFLLRDTEKPLLGALSSRQRDSLECLARISAVLGSIWPNSNDGVITTLGVYAVSLLSMLLENPHDASCFTEWDPFGILIPLMITLPSLLNASKIGPPSIITGSAREGHALKLVFLSLIGKIGYSRICKISWTALIMKIMKPYHSIGGDW